VQKMLKTLHQPEPRLSSDYDRSILKSYNIAKVRSRFSSASEKSVHSSENKKTRAPRS
jgi:hypothetical protein